MRLLGSIVAQSHSGGFFVHTMSKCSDEVSEDKLEEEIEEAIDEVILVLSEEIKSIINTKRYMWIKRVTHS